MLLIGHEWVLECLYRQLQAGKLRRSHLLLGPKRVGKTTLALVFAMRLLCERPEGPWPCGECRACSRVAARLHPDAIVIDPVGNTFSVDQVRELERELPLSPVESNVKVRVLTDFDLASREAQNALLKTLEEPPAHALIFLTAANVEALAPTISSRCQIWRLRPVPPEQISAALIARGLDEAGAKALAREALGCPGWAIAAAAEPNIGKLRVEAFELAQELASKRRYERFALLEPLARRSRQEVQQVVTLWQLWWRARLIQIMSSQDGIDARMPQLIRVAQFLRELQQAELALVHNANIRLVLDMLAIRMPAMPESSPPASGVVTTTARGYQYADGGRSPV